MINLVSIIESVLTETTMAGGPASAFGAGVQSTASQFSGDTYAPGDTRTPKSIYSGVLTRKGLIKRRKKNKVKR